MKKKPCSYARFYALLKRMPGECETIKQTLVSRFTQGRTTSLREVNAEEYETMCKAMEAEIAHPGMSTDEYQDRLRRARSAALRRMRRYGIDTADWDAIDAFTSDARIAGKRFALLSIDELNGLTAKLEAIARKGKKSAPRRVIHVPIFVNPNRLPS